MPHEVQEEIETLLTNNDEPSQETAHEVRRLLIEPNKELKELNTEIQRLEKHLELLRVRRRKVSTTITRYNSIVSPIRRIPSDVLLEIFTHCIPEDHNPVISASEAPILLTHICSSWRSRALSSPRLWSRIHISFTNHDLLPDVRSSHPNDGFYVEKLPRARIIQILRLRYEAVEQWILRSKACPLSISMHYTDYANRDFPPVNGNIPLPDISKNLFKILASVSNRWHHMEITMPVEIFNVLVDGLTLSDFPKLTTLRMSFSNSWDFDSQILSKMQILKTQSLTRLSVDVPLPEHTLYWGNITSLSFHASLAVEVTANLLAKCPALINFKVTLKPHTIPTLVDNHSIKLPSILHLPQLRTLHIIDTTDHHSTGFYNSIDAPELRSVSYTAFAPHDYNIRFTVPIASLFRKSTKLKTLRLQADNHDNTAIWELLHSASSVTKFAYGPDTQDNTEFVGFSRHMNTISTIWNFSDVFLTQQDNRESTLTDRPTAVPPASGQTLLPHLETLDVSRSVSITGLSDDNLLEFIINRMRSSPSSSLLPLRHVVAGFGRDRQLDIKDRVQNHTKRLGITDSVNLDLTYTARTPDRKWLATNADYGLDWPMTSKAWTKDRIDEEMAFND